MKIIPKLDAGPFMLQKSIKIGEKENFISLSNKLSELSSKLILEALSIFENNQVQFKDQQDKLVTYAKKIEKKDSENKENIIEQLSIKRIGKPEDISNVVAFLCNDESEYITGQVIPVDGGLTT